MSFLTSTCLLSSASTNLRIIHISESMHYCWKYLGNSSITSLSR